MALIDDMAGALIWLIRIGAGLRLGLIALSVMGDDEKEIPFKTRSKHTVWFYILSESIYQIQALIAGYF